MHATQIQGDSLAIIELVIQLIVMILNWLVPQGATQLTAEQKLKLGELRTKCRLFIDQCDRLQIAEIPTHTVLWR